MQFADLSGLPLQDGYVYFGTENLNPETNPIVVYWDQAGTQPAVQPLRTINGYIVRNGTIANVYSVGACAITVKDKKLNLVYYTPSTNSITATFIASLAASGGSALVGFIRPEATAIARTMQDKGREIPSIMDWNGVTPGTGTDSTVGIQNAITEYAASGGGPLLWPGQFKITGTITIPGVVKLVGRGGGRVAQPTVVAQSAALWYGGAAEMFKFGWQAGDSVIGGGMSGIRLDGRGLATRGISFKDFQHANFENVVITGVTSDGMYFTNTAGYSPSGFSNFQDNQILLRGLAASINACGVFLDGQGTGVDGITKCIVSDMLIEHANGHGVKIGERGDAFTWENLFTYRSDIETGFGVIAAGVSASQSINDHTFNSPVVTGGYFVTTPNSALGWLIDRADDVNVNVGITFPVSGPGATDVEVRTSVSTRIYGPPKTRGFRNSIIEDPMFFRRWDSANNTLITSAGNYLTGGNYVGASIVDATIPGGAIQLNTSGNINELLYFSNSPALGTSGFSASYKPHMCVIWTPLDAVTFLERVGFVADLGDPPVNGIYVEAAPGTNANYRCVCRKAGVETAVVTTLGAGLAVLQWRIEVDATYVRFLYRAVGNNGWGLAAMITTNIPVVVISDIVYIKTLAAATKGMRVYDYKIGFEVEI